MASAEGYPVMELSVPGNLLLAGEYLVLDEGGQGLAVAVEPRATASATDPQNGAWSIRAIMGKSNLSWQPGFDDDLPLAAAMMLSCAEVLKVHGKPMPAPLAIEVDSSAFFTPGGRKTGFGSSAAAAVAIALLVGRAAGLQGLDLTGFSAEAALAGHRAAQGGRGSGYDVYASLHGGTGIFTGGTKPGWEALGVLPPFHGVLVPGPEAVRSSEAVGAFRHWVAGQLVSAGTSRGTSPAPEAVAAREVSPAAEARIILDQMKAGVSALVDATISGNADTFRSALDQAGAAGRLLGVAIGYSAFIKPPEGFETHAVKALGAGNELGLMLLNDMMAGYPESLPPGCLSFRPTGGPQWIS